VRGLGGFEIAVKKNAAGDSGSTGGVLSKLLELSIKIVHRFFVEFVACNCTLLPEISCIAGAVEDVDNVVLLVRLTWLAYVSEEKPRQVFNALEIVFGVFFGVEALGGFN
jgi:hypothetical protein